MTNDRTMKKTAYIFLIAAAAVFSASCSDFLKETDTDLVVPRTVEHYRAMLNGEAYLTLVDYFYTDLMTDDVTDIPGANTQSKNNWKSLYTWQRDLELDGNGKENAVLNFSWLRNYKLIAILNYVIEEIDRAEGEAAQKTYLKGEAHCLRAKCYLELVNLYAKHYDAATAATDLGVPIRLGIGVEDTYVRSTVAEVYRVIEEDLALGIELMTQSKVTRTLWSMNPLAAKLLQSRVYLYKQEHQKCVAACDELIERSGLMLWDLPRNTSTQFVSFANPEVMHTWGPYSSVAPNNFPDMYYGSALQYKASDDLVNLFLRGDARKNTDGSAVATCYIQTVAGSGGAMIPKKSVSQFTTLGAFTYRLAEAYLNRAESNFSLGNEQDALADVTELVRHRVSDITKVTIPAEGASLLGFIRAERRREFCFEGLRWYDLKRWTDQRQPISHSYSSADNNGGVIGSETYVLLANDPNYILPIPKEEIEGNNELLIQNDRYAKRPIRN